MDHESQSRHQPSEQPEQTTGNEPQSVVRWIISCILVISYAVVFLMALGGLANGKGADFD